MFYRQFVFKEASEYLFHCFFQRKYKEGKRSLCQSVYSQLPETSETQFVKRVSEVQSEVSDAEQ